MEKVTLQTLNRGAVIDLFNVEFEKLLANINDENTSPTTSRSITIKIEVKPGKTRRDAESRISVTSRLAPIKPAESTLYLDSKVPSILIAMMAFLLPMKITLSSIH